MATLTKEPWVTGEIITADKLNKTTDGSRYILTLTDADRDTIDSDDDGIGDYNSEHFKYVIKLNEAVPVEDFLGMIIQCIATDERYVELAYDDARYFKAFRIAFILYITYISNNEIFKIIFITHIKSTIIFFNKIYLTFFFFSP